MAVGMPSRGMVFPMGNDPGTAGYRILLNVLTRPVGGVPFDARIVQLRPKTAKDFDRDLVD
jgi:hypothetical protein